MKSKLLQLSAALALGALWLTSCAQHSDQRRSGRGVMFENRIAIPVKDTTGLLLTRTTVASDPVTVPGVTSQFTVYVPVVPSGSLDSNGKLPMKFEAYRAKIDPSFGALKVVTSSSGTIFETGSGLFDGNESYLLTPATGSEDVHENPIQFKLKTAAQGGLTEDELLLIVARAPATGSPSSSSPVYEAAIFYTVEVP